MGGLWGVCVGHVAPSSETCNGIDDDCDGATDEALLATGCCTDGDNDGYGAGSASARCRDASRAAHGFCPVGYTDNNMDCNDANAAVRPGGTEACNGVDDDCDGAIDDGVLNTYYIDADHDGFGSTSVTTSGCSPPNGYVAAPGDCDDSDATIHPGATELCDGVDQNCTAGTTDEQIRTFYQDSDGDLYGTPLTTVSACSPPAGYTEIAGDCDDSDSAVHPGATEICDGQDNDCDSNTDEAPAALHCAGQYPFAINVASWSCTGTCEISACNGGWVDCDTNLFNGCECSS